MNSTTLNRHSLSCRLQGEIASVFQTFRANGVPRRLAYRQALSSVRLYARIGAYQLTAPKLGNYHSTRNPV
jgi:hypothetical protein